MTPPIAPSLLSLRSVTRTYPNGVRALQGISLDIGPGLFGLLGPNGAGKSSLMRTIATLQAPDSGTVHFDGRDIFDNVAGHRALLGYLPQDIGVYPGLTEEKIRFVLETFREFVSMYDSGIQK